VTAFGEATMFICKCLLMLAIKQLTGLSFFVAGAQVDLSQLRSSLTAVNTEILGYDVETLSKFKIDRTQDFDALSRQVMPALKQFLSQKDKSLMGVKPSNDADGRQRWLCDEHFVNTAVGGDVPNYKASNRQNGGVSGLGASNVVSPVQAVVPAENVVELSPAYETFPRTGASTTTAAVQSTASTRSVAITAEKSILIINAEKVLPPTPASGGFVRNLPQTDSKGGYTSIPSSPSFSLPIPETEPIKTNYHNPYLNTDTKQGYSSLERVQTISGITHTTEPIKTNYHNPYLNTDPIDTKQGFNSLERSNTVSVKTDPPKTNYYNLYLADTSQSSADTKQANAQLERGQTISGYSSYDNGQYHTRHGRSATTTGGYDFHQQHGNNVSLPTYSQETSTHYNPPVIQYPNNYQPYNQNVQQPNSFSSQPHNPNQHLSSNASHAYPPSYPTTSPYNTPPSQSFYTPLTMGPSSPVLSDHHSDRSTSPLGFNPLLPLTLQRGFQPPPK
jgi:hypothetical protein